MEFSTQTKMTTGGLVPGSLPLGQAKEAVKVAPVAGYCHIDCKYTYYNESEMEEAIQEKMVEKIVKLRGRLFTASNLWTTCFERKLSLS